MSENNFLPLTPIFGIQGSSYGVQLGIVNNKWKIRLMRGKEELKHYTYKDLENENLPNKNDLTAWTLSSIPLEINSYQVQRTISILLEYAIKNKKKSKLSIRLDDAKNVKLKNVQESEIRRSQDKGWVIDGYSCPFCGLLIVKCPSCGSKLIKANKR